MEGMPTAASSWASARQGMNADAGTPGAPALSWGWALTEHPLPDGYANVLQ